MNVKPIRVVAATACVLLALAAYLPSATSFLSDDFVFLEALRTPGRPIYGWPSELAGQFLRPAVMLSLAVDHAIWGLAASGFHATNLVLHMAAALLVLLTVREITGKGPSSRWIAASSGLYFLAAAPHTEAVSWVSGRTDLMATVFGLLAIWSWARFRASADRRLIILSYAAFSAALLAKESVITLPLVIVAIDFILRPSEDATTGLSRRERALAVAGFFAIAGMYLGARYLLFTTALGAYPNFRLSAFRIANNLRVFWVRSVIPGTPWTRALFAYRLDVVAAGTALLLLWRLRGPARRGALAAAVGLVICLLPVLPLEISLSDTQSERFVYLPSAFAAMLVGCSVAALPAAALIKDVALGLLIAANLVWLGAANRSWEAAGRLSAQVIDTFAARVHESGLREDGMVFVLNLPDNVRGAYVHRNGFYQVLRFRHPDVGHRAPFIIGVSSHSLATDSDEATVRQIGPQSFVVDVSPNRFLTPPPSTPYYEVENQSDSRYRIDFKTTFPTGLVLYMTRGQMVSVARVGTLIAAAPDTP